MGKPTKEQLERYCELRAKKSALDSESRSMDTELHQIHEAIVEYMTAMNTKACKLHRYSLMLVPGRANPKWKDAFIRVAGYAAATLEAASTEKPDQLKVLEPEDKSEK